MCNGMSIGPRPWYQGQSHVEQELYTIKYYSVQGMWQFLDGLGSMYYPTNNGTIHYD